jgi:crotonobetainyl-CoA:carnitine CoA-transferase CaiB-like acyl-CoA transferase
VQPPAQPLRDALVVDLTRYLPGAYASRELLRLGARVVRLEAPDGDPMRHVAPAWDAALSAGKESVACDLKAEPELGQALCARADVVLESFRPGVAARLGVGPDDVPARTVYCSITGFGLEGPHTARAGHDLNYLGWAGVLEDTAPALPPIQPADLAAGALAATVEILAALLERERTGRGARLTISMTHGSHRLVAHRLGGDPLPRFLTGGIACYGIYATADRRHLTVGALEPKFFVRLCEVIGRPELAELHLDGERQEELRAELAAVFGSRPLGDWLELCDREDVAVGPVATLAEAAAALGAPADARAPEIGEQTAAWRRELGLE